MNDKTENLTVQSIVGTRGVVAGTQRNHDFGMGGFHRAGVAEQRITRAVRAADNIQYIAQLTRGAARGNAEKKHGREIPVSVDISTAMNQPLLNQQQSYADISFFPIGSVK
ncbi:MAG: hypothetical protein Q7T96_09265 [Methylobacter sp.]|nr:hypothetical protein [Methylobacter sp.]